MTEGNSMKIPRPQRRRINDNQPIVQNMEESSPTPIWFLSAKIPGLAVNDIPMASRHRHQRLTVLESLRLDLFQFFIAWSILIAKSQDPFSQKKLMYAQLII